MRIDFYTHDESAENGFRVTGSVALVNGKVEALDDPTARFLAEWTVVEPGDPERVLTTDDGFAYMRAIPYNLRSMNAWAGWGHDGLSTDDLTACTERLRLPPSQSTVEGSLPVLFFGDFLSARVVTIALNPSDRECREKDGRALIGSRQRFASLDNYPAPTRAELRDADCVDAVAWMRAYFMPGRPTYWPYFSHLERFLDGSGYSYQNGTAAHLDLIQEPTAPVWRHLPDDEKSSLLARDLPFLVWQLRSRPLEAVFCNGKTVSETLKQHLDLVTTKSGKDGKIRWWIGRLNLDEQSIPAAGWNYPLNQATGHDGPGQTEFGRRIAEALRESS